MSALLTPASRSQPAVRKQGHSRRDGKIRGQARKTTGVMGTKVEMQNYFGTLSPKISGTS